MTSIKEWTQHDDQVLSILCKKIIDRRLLKIELQDSPFMSEHIDGIIKKTSQFYNISEDNSKILIIEGKINNKAYNPKKDKINLLYKNGRVVDIAEASDQLNISVLAQTVTKHFLCYPKESLV
jgi:hypothetical protein